eukprot:10110135-Ditylum_brightwellii.AAC.1
MGTTRIRAITMGASKPKKNMRLKLRALEALMLGFVRIYIQAKSYRGYLQQVMKLDLNNFKRANQISASKLSHILFVVLEKKNKMSSLEY